MLEIAILRNSSQKLGVLRGAFEAVCVSKRHSDALLAKHMHPLRNRSWGQLGHVYCLRGIKVQTVARQERNCTTT